MSEGIQSVQRALYVLERLASCKEGATASEIAKELGVNRSTILYALIQYIQWPKILRKNRVNHFTINCFILPE